MRRFFGLCPLVLAAASLACGARTDLAVDELREAPDGPRCGNGIVEPPEACDDGDRTDGLCTERCRLETCGNGAVDAGEQCDLGDENEDRPALAVRQEGLYNPLVPRWIEATPDVFYGYYSKSAHTGFEVAQTSNLFFTLGLDGQLALTTLHGIDVDATGSVQPKGVVDQLFSGLPLGTGIVLADDGFEEFGLETSFHARGLWAFETNTDGGVLGPLPFPGAWTIAVDTSFDRGIDTWRILGDAYDYESLPIGLDASETAYLIALDSPSRCRLDCSEPRCGDARLDGGEVCDDGNVISGDGCRSDCRARDD